MNGADLTNPAPGVLIVDDLTQPAAPPPAEATDGFLANAVVVDKAFATLDDGTRRPVLRFRFARADPDGTVVVLEADLQLEPDQLRRFARQVTEEATQAIRGAHRGFFPANLLPKQASAST